MIALLLAKKIAELFCYLLIGFVMVRLRVLDGEDSVPLSKISLYLITPCTIFHAFQIEASASVMQGFLIALVTAALLQALFILMARAYRRVTHVSVVDEALIVYPNAGNLVIPLVAATLGQEWVIYVSAYIVIFNVLAWTHGIRMFTKDSSYYKISRILFNPNILACALGALCLVSGIRLTGIPGTVIAAGASFIGPLTMFITGMVLATIRLKEFFANHALYGTLLMRMIICPLAALFVIRLLAGVVTLPQAETLFLIVLLSASAPAANAITQFAILFHHDAKYASVISVATTLVCIATMPFMIWLYGIL